MTENNEKEILPPRDEKQENGVRLITFGCRLNTYESEVMKKHAKDAGLKDAIIVNTCAVTGEAERQARQAIRKARRENPNARIIATGCAADKPRKVFFDGGGGSGNW